MDAFAVRLTCRSELAREAFGLGLGVLRVQPIGAVGRRIGFALLGESLLAIAGWPAPPKGTKRSCPCIRVSLRETSLIPSPLQGPAYKGRPWPFIAGTPSPLAASMPLAPLRADSIRPPERGVSRRLAVRAMEKQLCPQADAVGWKTAKHFPPQSTQRLVSNVERKNRWVSFALPTLRSLEARTYTSLHGLSGATESPLSGGRAQVAWKGLSGMDAARGLGAPPTMGQGWPFAAGPWSVTGAREPRRSRGRMEGQAFLLTFFGAGRPAFEKSESPCKAKPVGGAEESAASDARIRATSGEKRSAVSHSRSPGQAKTHKAHPVVTAVQSATFPYLRPSQNGSYRTPRVMVPQC
jgi:hypothetical protein